MENFNQNSSKLPILDSPRSIEACKRQGIRPDELIVKTLEDIKKMYNYKILDEKSLLLKQSHYEERRKEKIRVLLEERNQLIEEEKSGILQIDDRGSVKVWLLFSLWKGSPPRATRQQKK